MNVIVYFICLGIGSIIIARACDGFEYAADYLGRNMSDGVKGATINAIGSSMPEFFITFIYLFLFHDTTGFSGGIGATAGSAVFNIMIIPALVILAVHFKGGKKSIQIDRHVLFRDGLALVLAELILIIYLDKVLQWKQGLILIILYLVYLAYIMNSQFKVKKDKKHESPGLQNTELKQPEHDHEAEFQQYRDIKLARINRFLALCRLDLKDMVIGSFEINTITGVILLSVSGVVIAAGCWVLVYACEGISNYLQVPGYFTAVILAAAASSLPDTILSVKDGCKGNYNDAFSNAIGSNLFDICFALGVPLFIYTLIYGPIVIDDVALKHIIELRILLLFMTICCLCLFELRRQLNILDVGILFCLYLIFAFYIIGQAMHSEITDKIASFIYKLSLHKQI